MAIIRFPLPNTVRGDTPRVVILLCDMLSQPYVQSYQVSSMYLKRCWGYQDHKVSIRGDNSKHSTWSCSLCNTSSQPHVQSY